MGLQQINSGNLNQDKLAKRIAKILSSGARIKGIIESVRQMIAVRSGKFTPQYTSVSVSEIFEPIDTDFSSKMNEKEIKFVVENDLPENTMIKTDMSIFYNSIIANTISNSIKFTPKGGTITLSCTMSGSKFVEIAIKDSGIGIPKEILDYLFDPYVATSRPGTENEKGTGFGMPLVESSIKTLGGSIQVNSKTLVTHPNDSGTTMTLKVPISMAHNIIQTPKKNETLEKRSA